jgi:HEAT repeat protein
VAAVPAVTDQGISTDPEMERALAKLKSEDAGDRKEARQELLAVGSVVLPDLLGLIEDPYFLTRWEVVNILGYLEDERALLPLVDRAVLDPNPHVRWRALWALAVLNRDDVITAEFVRRMEIPSERWNAAVGLSMFGHPQAIGTLLEGIHSEDSWIRFEAIYGLGRSFDEHTSAALIPLLAHPEVKTRQELVMTLGRIGDETAVEGLITALGDTEPRVRWRAAMGLRLAGDPQSVDALTELLESETDATVVEHAQEALNKLQRKSSRPVAPPPSPRPAVTAPAPAIPAPAKPPPQSEQVTAKPPLSAQEREELGREVTGYLRQFSGNSEQRRKARKALLELGPPIIPDLINRLDDPNFAVRWEIVNLLGNLGDPSAVDALIDRAIFDNNHHVRWRSLWALAAIDDDSIGPRLVSYLEHENWHIRWRAAVGASMFGRQEATPVLIEGLRDPNSFIRWEAVNALARVPGGESTTAVLPLLEDPDLGVQREVVLYLGRVADARAIPVLIELLEHPDPQIRWRAARGLGLARYQPALVPLKNRLQRESVEIVRRHIEQTIESLEGQSRAVSR